LRVFYWPERKTRVARACRPPPGSRSVSRLRSRRSQSAQPGSL